MNWYAAACIGSGIPLSARTHCFAQRLFGASLLTVGLLIAGTAALADQTLMVSDNSKVECIASAKDLTRVSLIGDGFASVSKVSSGNPADDFSVVNEPVRGDIYLSVPEGYGARPLSFFATTKKGYVYKFSCHIQGDEATQVFLSNPAIANQNSGQTMALSGANAGGHDEATALIKAMYNMAILPGYRMKQPVKASVRAGDLKIQEIAQYEGSQLVGHHYRIENRGTKPIDLSQLRMAPPTAEAVSLAIETLAAGQITTAYVVQHQGSQ